MQATFTKWSTSASNVPRARARRQQPGEKTEPCWGILGMACSSSSLRPPSPAASRGNRTPECRVRQVTFAAMK